MKNRETNISNKIIDICQLPKDVLLGASIISITGNREILIENFKNIIKYQSEILILQCKNNQIQLVGKNLKIEFYTKDAIKINGYISEIKFL